MLEYYGRRAQEYERIYQRDDPVERAELAGIRATILEVFPGRRVLEVACGTGFWTQVLAEVAESVMATDASPEVLDEARKKGMDSVVELREAGAYDLAAVPGSYDAALATFWLSHVPRARLAGFLDQLHRRLEPGAVVLLVDSVFVPGLGGHIVASDETDDTFKLRTLESGEEYRVLKNYHSEEELRRLFAATDRLRLRVGERYWRAEYRTA